MILLLLITFLLDLILEYYLPFLPTFCIYFEPLLFVSSMIIYLITFYDKKKCIYIVLGSSICYDLFFGTIPFLYLFLFFILSLEISFIRNKINSYFFTDLFLFTISLISFFILKYLILIGVNYSTYSISFLINQIYHHLSLNILYGIILYYFLGIKKKKT